MEIMPGIYQFRLPVLPFLREDTNVYLIRGDEGWLLLDVGWDTPQAIAALEQQLREVGLEFKDISQIVITHAHPDHYGMAAKIKQFSHAALVMHQKEIEYVETRYIKIDALVKETTEWLRLNGVPEEELSAQSKSLQSLLDYVTPIMPDTVLMGGELISTGPFQLQVLWTPGHAPGHICLYEQEKRVLFSGDHILPITTTNVGIHFSANAASLDDYLDSLAKMKKLDVDLILPAHEHIFRGLQQRIEELRYHHQERDAALAATLTGEPKTAYQIATKIPWMVEFAGVGWPDLSPLNRRLAIGETLSHLQSLMLRGEVQTITKDRLIFYHHN